MPASVVSMQVRGGAATIAATAGEVSGELKQSRGFPAWR